MAQVIKAYSVNTTTPTLSTVYTVPASTIAKVQITFLAVAADGASTASALVVGQETFSCTRSSAGTSTLSFGNSKQVTADTAISSVLPPLTFYLVAGQTITTARTAGSGSISIKAQICVTEVPA